MFIDKESLLNILIKSKLAVKYDGGKKTKIGVNNQLYLKSLSSIVIVITMTSFLVNI